MDERGQFTFYESFWASIQLLEKKDRLPILEALISYALYGTLPEGLTKSQLAYFLLIKPNLDASRKKAKSGKAGGSVKQTASKPQANGKQPVSEKEREKENEKEVEIEGEIDKEQTESTPNSGKPFTAFWEAYPKKIDREGAWEAWKALNPSPDTAEQIISALSVWKESSGWTKDGDQYIPNAAKFLSQKHWQSPPRPGTGKNAIPKGASGKLGAAELENIKRILQEDEK